jgi:hypothetical protein
LLSLDGQISCDFAPAIAWQLLPGPEKAPARKIEIRFDGQLAV